MEDNLKAALDMLSAEIKRYRELKDLSDGHELNHILQQVVGILFYLEKERAEYHDKFQTFVKDKVKDKVSINRAENLAYTEYPNYYLIRRIMDAGYVVSNAIRTHISYIKKEKSSI